MARAGNILRCLMNDCSLACQDFRKKKLLQIFPVISTKSATTSNTNNTANTCGRRLATCLKIRGSNPGGGEIFRTCPNGPWGIKSGRGVTLTPHPLLVPWS